jgi:hypothetical protein
MPDWWERGYPGGPMVAVKGFPRPLYPPDAAPGHQPSSDGSDVEAYKRTVSRAGRWRWQPFDQAYSNGFAHGKSGGNVAESGIAGVQRQGKITPDSGWVGRDTFNLLRSIRIPAGLPHAGEAAMDARAVELVNAAWDRFGGLAQPGPDNGSSAQARLAKAQREVGTKEQPAGSNEQKYGAWYGMNGQPWCAMFVTWCDQLSARPSAGFARGFRYAYVPYIVSDARLAQNGLSIVTGPQPGDLVCFDWAGDGEYDHVGLVATPADAQGTFGTIEGNTSMSDNSNGGQVMQRTRNRGQQPTVFVRVREP